VFALNELLAMKRVGMLAAVFALKAGEEGAPQPAAAELEPFVELIPPGDVWTQAATVAARLAGTDVAGVHGYFAHDPAAVAAETSALLGIPYGFSVHALDARKVAHADLVERAAKAAVVISCNRDAAAEVAAVGTTPLLVPHGVDLAAFAPSDPPCAEPVSLLAVGRLVEKKGFDVLIDALAQLHRPFALRLVGDGPLRLSLTAAVEARGLAGRVEMVGRRTHGTLPDLYAAADLVVVPSVVDSRGDRDGLPNVVLEAMASQRPVVASDVAAISTAVRHSVTGLLVPPGDAGALARALRDLIDAPARRATLGLAARGIVEREFSLGSRTAEFCRTLELAYG